MKISTAERICKLSLSEYVSSMDSKLPLSSVCELFETRWVA